MSTCSYPFSETSEWFTNDYKLAKPQRHRERGESAEDNLASANLAALCGETLNTYPAKAGIQVPFVYRTLNMEEGMLLFAEQSLHPVGNSPEFLFGTLTDSLQLLFRLFAHCLQAGSKFLQLLIQNIGYVRRSDLRI